ncbi:MAG: ABC transporter substrate-binding protein [Thermoplasmata archaeon]
MNKKALYAVIAVVVVIVLVVAVLEVIPTSSSASMTVSTSTTTATVGQSITFAAFISGGTPSSVVFNFGDGNTGTATHLSGNEYTVTHSYSSAGKYLVTATATVNGKTADNMKSINEISVTPASVSPTVASEITVPSIITSTQIFAPGSTVSLTASTLQPPTATNWTIGYYIWNFGDGSTSTNYTVFNTSSGNFMAGTVNHLYSTAGIYTVTLGVITFNATNYVPKTYTSYGINYTYYPVSELSSILSSGQYQNTTYMSTIVVNSTAQLLKTSAPHTNPSEITVTEVVPGGAYSFDPAIDYETVGFEEIMNVYETLIQYNGSSTSQSQMFPEVATQVPTVANGGISANYLSYTFHIRSGLKFANGDPLTAWDAYTSFVRTLLFVQGSPGTAGWILAQDLLPAGGFAPGLYTNGTALYDNITSAITVNNVTQTVTFHLLKADPAFLDYIADPIGGGIIDYSWAVAHGAGITFTPAGFLAYTSYSMESNYNNYLRYNTMGSGPYMIKSYQIGQSVTLAPNPYYTPIPGVPGFNHTANDTIYIQWEKDPSTALLIAESGQTDIIEGLPTYDYPIMAQLQSQGKITITPFPTLSIFWFEYNFNVNTTMLPTLGSGYTIPQYYFTNLDVRRAWSYAFNYTNYIENLVGNAKYGADFAFHYTGVIPEGMPGYMTPEQLTQAGAVVPVYNLTIAKQYMIESGLYNTSINIPIIVYAGDPVDFAAVQDWITTMESIDPNIHATALYMEFSQIIGYMVAGQNPMPIYILGWAPDYPFPSDYMIPMYQENGTYGAANAWNPQILAAAGHPNQAKEDALMNQYIADAQATGNATLALKYYDQAEVLGVNLTFYTYTEQENAFWFYSSNLHGVQYEQNAIYGGGGDTMYIYLWKS